ncbi:MAG: hypothetical protein M1814_004790 [Vezdaea aestivalis]|nr:MAG: hypothetical protein M1814_004790 [Vezdaea aestivalis]
MYSYSQDSRGTRNTRDDQTSQYPEDTGYARGTQDSQDGQYGRASQYSGSPFLFPQVPYPQKFLHSTTLRRNDKGRSLNTDEFQYKIQRISDKIQIHLYYEHYIEVFFEDIELGAEILGVAVECYHQSPSKANSDLFTPKNSPLYVDIFVETSRLTSCSNVENAQTSALFKRQSAVMSMAAPVSAGVGAVRTSYGGYVSSSTHQRQNTGQIQYNEARGGITVTSADNPKPVSNFLSKTVV